MEIKVVRQILEWNEDCHKEVQEELNDKYYGISRSWKNNFYIKFN